MRDSSRADGNGAFASEASFRGREDCGVLFERAVVGIYRTSVEGNLITANTRFAEIMGYSSPEEMQRAVPDVNEALYVHPEERRETMTAVSRDNTYSLDTRVYTRDGGTRWISDEGRAVRDKDGNIQYFEGFIQDISGRKEAEERLRDRNRRLEQKIVEQESHLGELETTYRGLVDNALVGVYRTRLNGEILFLNDTFFRTFGWDSKEDIVLQGSPAHYKHPADREVLLRILEQSGAVNGYEVELKTKSGAPVRVLLSATLKGDVISGMILDITERKMAEELLRAREEQYRVLVEAAPFPVVISRPEDGVVLYLNQMASDLFKVPPKDWVRLKARDYYYDPADRDLFTRQLAEDGFVRDHYTHLKDARGEEFWVLLSANMIDFNGERAVCSAFNDVSELTYALDRMQESEVKYRTLFDNANDAIFLIDIDKDAYIDCNHKALTTFRCSKEDIIGQTPYILSPLFQPDGCGSVEKGIALGKAALSGKPQFFEWRHSRMDGSRFDAEVSLSHVEIGKERLLQGIVRDVSERKEAEQKLRSSEEKYRSIFDNAVEGIFQSTPEGTYIAANPALARMYGYDSPQELMDTITDIGKEQYMNPLDRSKFKALLEARGRIEGFEVGIYTKHRQKVWVSMSARAAKDREGTTLFYEGFAEDITRRKAMEGALRESEERYRTFIDSTSDMVFLKDDRFRNIIMNKKLLKFSGKSEDEVIGRTDFEFMPPESAKIARLTDVKAIESSTIVISEQTIGDRIYETRKFPVKLGENVNGVGGFIRDITEQKRYQKELKVKSLNLEEVNAALRVLLEQREDDKSELEERILYNVKKLAFPYIHILKQRRLDEEQQMYVNILETNLKNIISPFVQKMMYAYSNFTPTEILVANFIRDGKTIKEIAVILGVSENAVNRHRQHVRNKLGLNKRKTNLKVYLMSLK